MEIKYRVTMLHDDGKRWILMDSGSEKSMQAVLEWNRKHIPLRKFRLEKHTMEVIDV